ncbi:MAG: glycosyltransferase [Bacteroidota bacterium]|nr:glycosyltransferase [Bacteroidota bacterium]
MNNQTPNIWLAYVSYPVTTAVYFERALKQQYNVTTIGPTLPRQFIESWNLENMKLPIKPLDIDTDSSPDLEYLIAKTEKQMQPDMFLWVESVNGYFPQNLSKVNIPKACYFIDSHINLQRQLEWAKNFDFVFIAQIEYIDSFKKAGIENVYWLPLGCDLQIHSKKTDAKLFDVGFVGSLGAQQDRRYQLLSKIGSRFQLSYKRCFWEEMSEHFAQSKIVFNNAILNDLNMRVFEAMSTGSFLLTDQAKNSGQEEMFVDGEDLGIYTDSDILDKVEYYLKNETIREKIADHGRQIVHNAHTYKHRVDELVKVALYGQKNTPDPLEWRDRSVNNVKTNIPTEIPQPKRSFVIPVLDMSPASPFNIVKLLDDLEEIPGEVIIIFNSLDMAEKLKNHPRIDYYAIMNENVGVSRAWNIGLNISQAPVTFILNSDLHIEKQSVDLLERYLLEIENAAIVGPQGSFFHYESGQDLLYFDKGSFNYPIEVDAVSGFFFAVKTDYFNSGTLKFDNQYSPCYFEEWDLGLQIKLAGLKSYVVPVTGYEHEWSGSIRALRMIRYLKKEETAGQIHERNQKLFWKKWNEKKEKNKDRAQIFNSHWIEFFTGKADKLVQFGMLDEAGKFYKQVLQIYPKSSKSLYMLGKIEEKKNNLQAALKYYEQLNAIDPEYLINQNDAKLFVETAKDNSDPIESEKFGEYYENPRPEIQQLINKSSKTILDVGCGRGKMASEIKTSLGSEVWGIELVKSAAVVAKDRLDHVLIGKVEDNIRQLPDAYFDSIIFADVLEHLIDPLIVLSSIKTKLTNDGEIIASIPNVRFWNVVKNLLSGFWEYEEAGIMDNSHLRFFTRNSIYNLFDKAGLKIKDLYSLRVQSPDLPKELLDALSKEGVNTETLNAESKDFQYLVRAIKKDN